MIFTMVWIQKYPLLISNPVVKNKFILDPRVTRKLEKNHPVFWKLAQTKNT